MMDFLRRLLQMDAEEDVDLSEGEKILHVTGRHWIVLVTREIGPVLGMLFFAGLAAYRAVGGGFLVLDTGEPIGFDLFNIFLALVSMVFGLLWVSLWLRRSKNRRSRNALLIALGVTLLLLYFRYQGGRIFYINPSVFANQVADPLNIALMIGGVISLLFFFFTIYDWLNDELILTNQRVIYDNDQVYIPRLLEQRNQEQIFIEEVQDVSARTKTYLEHWLQYGFIEVKSARIGGNLKFESADDPFKMKKMIMDEVNRQRKTRSEKDLQRLIETRVYKAAAEKKSMRKDIRTAKGIQALRWVLPDNPEFNPDKNTYTWRAHWLFLLQGLVGPFVLLFGGWLAVLLGARLILVEPFWVTLAMFAVFIAFLAWAAYAIEDYRNDLYILSPTNVTDVEKKPFGPEDQRGASLGAINNVTFKTTLISNLLGYGDVILETAGSGGKFTFNHVPHPHQVVDVVNDFYVNFKKGEREKAFDDTLTLLDHYHAAQVRHNELNVPPASAD